MVDEILLGSHFILCSHASFYCISLLRVSLVREKKRERGRKGKKRAKVGNNLVREKCEEIKIISTGHIFIFPFKTGKKWELRHEAQYNPSCCDKGVLLIYTPLINYVRSIINIRGLSFSSDLIFIINK